MRFVTSFSLSLPPPPPLVLWARAIVSLEPLCLSARRARGVGGAFSARYPAPLLEGGYWQDPSSSWLH